MDQDYTPDLLSLTDEDGTEFSFEVLDMIETDTGKYVALLPDYESDEERIDDSGELVILKAIEENDETFYEEIEDEDEYETVAECFMDRLSDMFEIEQED